MTLKLRLFEILATPAHLWLWIVAKICGMEFTCGPANDEES